MSSAFSKSVKGKSKQQKALDPFSFKTKRQSKPAHLGSHFTNKSHTAKERSFLDDHFSKSNSGSSKSNLPDHFSKGGSKKERLEMPDHFSKSGTKKARASMPDFFSSGNENRERESMPDFFSKSQGSTERGLLQDHFGSETSEKKRALLTDHYSATNKKTEHSEKDLQSKGARKKFWRKNMTGERFRLFNIDPNKTKKSKRATRKKKHKKDPFGRNSRKMHRAQMPKGEGDLFPNGVLPKMEDFR